ncbi:protein POOR HOMOLOGOUS SYNAPSIS 1-like [Carex rostrata]
MSGMPSGKGLTFNSSASQDVPCKFHYVRKKKRASDEMSSEDPEAICREEEDAPQPGGYTNYSYTNLQEMEDNIRPLEPLMTCDNIESLFAEFPPSFTDFLANCSSNFDQGQIIPAGESCSAYQNGFMTVPSGYQAGPSNPCPQGVVPKTEILDSDESDLMAQISKYMNDDNFQDMLFRIEKLIGGLGGDSALF